MDTRPPGLSPQFKIRPDEEDLLNMGMAAGQSGR